MSITIVGGGNPSAPTFPVQRSVRLRSSASAYFNRTMTTPTNQKIWTWSAWIKLGAYTTSYNPLFAAGASGSAYSAVWFNSNSLVIYSYTGATSYFLVTTQVFRDYSAWQHIVVSVDTTQATSSNRIKLYVNGVQVTAFSTATYPSLNYNDYINSAVAHYIGQYTPALGSIYYDGYMTEINFIDGQALTPTSFGAYNSYGVWSPAKYTGTYGTNGFYLNFQDNSAATAAAIGKDSSGNGNNWTPNNISVTAGVTYDSMLDVPTLTSANNANFCTLNPLAANTSTTPTQGNLYLATNATYNFACVATMGVSSGKWYWEVKPDSGYTHIGVTSLSYLPANIGILQATTFAKAYYGGNGNKYDNGTQTAYGATFSSADLMGIALDMDAGTLTFYKNNVSQGTAFTGLSGVYFPAMGASNTYNAGYPNFGQRPFTYTPPTGFKALNTYNLPAPTIPNGAAYMAATTYTGTGATQSILNSANTTTGVSFQPDFVWIKSRNNIGSHQLIDSVRGIPLFIFSDATTGDTSRPNSFTSFNSNGFTVGSSSDGNTNLSTYTYVGWQWKANGTPAVVNTLGVIPSTISANPTAGFSIVTYTGTGTGALSSVGHGLGLAPQMIILKNRGSVTNWPVYHANLTSASYTVFLNATNAQAADIGYWGNTPPDSAQFYIYGTSGSYSNISGANYVAYCFRSIAGYSKFGSYTGNGSADGPFVYLGFRPRWIMWKRTDTTGSWYLYDTSRSTYNASVAELYPNLSNAEANSGTGIDILSNGWKIRTSGAGDPQVNASGGTYIYAAFAENPFNYSLAR